MKFSFRGVGLCCVLLVPAVFVSCQLFKDEGAFDSLEKPHYQARKIFYPGGLGPECHSSTIAELAGGDILAAWWCGSSEGAGDAALFASRLPKGADSWLPAWVLADIPDEFEGNPVLYSLPGGQVELFFVVVDSHPPGRVQIMSRESNDLGHTWSPIKKFITAPGIHTRNHPVIMENGEILFPLHDDSAVQSVFLISSDSGISWKMGASIVSNQENIQPTVISRDDGSLYALMRSWSHDLSTRYLLQSESCDYGRTWSAPTHSTIPTVSSAIEMIRLTNGHVVLAYNDGKERERTPLTLALSLDGGKTWPWKRNLESGQGSFSYPSVVQGRDGRIHITYSYNRKYIKHVELNEAWIRIGN